MSMSRCEWIRSERFAKKQKEEAKNREKNNPMKAGEKVGRLASIILQTFSTGENICNIGNISKKLAVQYTEHADTKLATMF